MDKIRICMCDDVDFLCQNIKEHIKYHDDLEFLGYCTSASGCAKMIKRYNPDVLLLDIQLESEYAGIEIIPSLLEEKSDLKIIVMSSYSYSDYIFHAIVNGAVDYITKDCSIEQIIEKIYDAYNNKSSLMPEISQKFTTMSRELNTSHKSLIYMLNIVITLSKTEFEILKLLCTGMSNNEIAKMRYTEVSTVRSTCSNILKKFHATNMKSLVNSINELHVFDYFKDLEK